MKYFCHALSDQNPPQPPYSNPNTSNNTRVEQPSRWLIVWAGISIALPVLLLYLYSCSNQTFQFAGFELKQILGNQDIDAMLAELDEPENKSTQTLPPQVPAIALDSNGNAIQRDTNMAFISNPNQKPFSLPAYELPIFADTTKHRILLIGDSESGGLRYPLNDYCQANGHKLILSLEWYSATTFNFGRSDTIQRIIARYKPTYIFLVFGLNELYARDLKARKIAANQLAKKLHGIPYTWIGPANWEEDNGINKVFQSSADSATFFLTKKLTLTRAGDGRHPDVQGYRVWMDSIAGWLQTSARYKMAMKPPRKRGRPFRAPIITINAAKYRGY